jgi:hypothetical protein
MVEEVRMDITTAFYIVLFGGTLGFLSAPIHYKGHETIAWMMLITAFVITISGAFLMIGAAP